MSRPRVGVLTFHRSVNYGSVLQAYALVMALRGMGAEVEIIDYAPPAQAEMYSVFEKVRSWKSIAKNARAAIIYSLLAERARAFDRFLAELLPVSDQKYGTPSDFEGLCGRYDAVVCGSDQIWNVNARDFAETYLLPFPHCLRKIAYGPSLNTGDFAQSRLRDTYKALLLDFDAISVREQSGKEKLDALLDGERPIRVVADPTLLLDAQDYHGVCSEGEWRTPHIFLYTINHDPRVIDAAVRLSRSAKLPVYTLFTGNGTYKSLVAGRGRIRLSERCSPRDFLGHIRHAEYVVTNSFHGTAFSVIFGQPFVAVSALNPDGTARPDTRIHNLLGRLGLEHRIVGPEGICRLAQESGTDIADAEKRRREYASHSKRFLADALAGLDTCATSGEEGQA